MQLLQKKLNLLEADIAVHREQVEALGQQAHQFTEEHHFDSEAIQKRQSELSARYEALQVCASHMMVMSHMMGVHFNMWLVWAWL